MQSTLRTHRALLILSLLALIALAGCSSDDDSPTDPGDNGNNGGNVATGTITCTIDGSARSFSNDAVGAVESVGRLVAAGSDATSQDTFVMSVPDAVGTFTFGDTDGGSLSMTVGAVPYIVSAANGTLTITEVDEDTLKGTFSVIMTNLFDTSATITITDGAFDIPVVR